MIKEILDWLGIYRQYRVGKYVLSYPASDFLFTKLLHSGYEKGTVDFVRSWVREGMNVVDVGAHVGYYSLLFADLVGTGGKVYSFEPDPENYAYLKANIKRNKINHVYCEPKIVCNVNGWMNLYLGGDGRHHSVMDGVLDGRLYKRLATVTLDSYFEQVGMPEIDLVKIDVEGAELLVIEDMVELIRRNKNIKVIWELSPRCLNKSGQKADNLFVALQNMGLSKFNLLADGGMRLLKYPDDVDGLMKSGGGNILAQN